jgi:hypothetical protein
MTDSSSSPAGWYLDGQDPRRRYWDGENWTGYFEESATDAPTTVKSLHRFNSKREKLKRLPGDQLDAILMAEVARWTARGWNLEGVMKLFGRTAVLREPRQQAFLRDLLLVVVTLGLWLIFIIYRALVGESTRKMIRVDRFGRVKSFRWTDRKSLGG